MADDIKVTIKDIANMAGVSTATVSRILNGKSVVKDSTKQRVQEIMQDLNYHPNAVARSLQVERIFTIGIVIPDIANTYHSEVFRGVEEVARAEGYSTLIYNTDYEVEKERDALHLLRSKKVDGLILQVSNRVTDECKSLVEMGYPIVLLGQFLEGVACPKVGCNNFSSAYTMTEYLIKAGHTAIAHVGGHRETCTGVQRMQGYMSAMENYGLTVRPEWNLHTNYSLSDAYDQTKKMLEQAELPTAIFAANDSIAVGCYQAIWEKGLRIPEDISLAGHDDMSFATILRPKLTTMRQKKREIGRIAARKLLASLHMEKPLGTDIVIVPTELVERDSVRVMG